MHKTIKGRRIAQLFVLSTACLLAASLASAQQLNFPGASLEDPVAVSKAMPELARQVIAVYREDDDRQKFLDNLFRLQLVAGQYADALKSLTALRAMQAGNTSPQLRANNVQYEIFARAKQSSADGAPLDEALRRSFREGVGAMDDRASALLMRALGVDVSTLRRTLDQSLQQQKGKSSISVADALRLIRAYQVWQAFESLAPLAPSLITEDDQRRYIIEKEVPVRTPDGATTCAMIVRQRSVRGRLPTLLNFTIYAEPIPMLNEARRSASNGYVGVIGLTRGKGCSPDKPVPYEHDGRDAAALIDWISRQAWSDGRVGMYGGSYTGFTQWAAAKHMPKALKALMPSVTVAPGIDVPMDGNLFLSFTYPWTFYTTNGKALDDATYYDNARWNRLNREWYISGRAYRELEKIDGTPNPVFARWVSHPDYDSYWQNMIPYGQEFARINIPVLTTTGYYDGGQMGALYYFAQHYRYNPRAEHYLVIGPYNHISGQRGNINTLGDYQSVFSGYTLDPAARLDIGELRYQWFDYVLKGGPKPALLKDKVNYEVMGANEWRHAPSLAAMASETQRFHLSALQSGDTYRLSEQKPAGDAFITQTVNLADRSDIDRVSPSSGDIVDKNLDTWNSIAFISEPLAKPAEISGLFSGRLDFITNKKDLDFQISLYELSPTGEYFQLSYYWARASYVRDRSQRHLLEPGQRQKLDFKSGRLTSRKFQQGSRIVVLLSILKLPIAQINYGTGKDVSDETIADAGEPLQIKWFDGSFIDIPVRR
jgi:putative CocE/NonD family hydrolase